MSNGKGSRARNNMSQAFRDNYDLIFRKKDDLAEFEAILGPRRPKPAPNDDPRLKYKEWIVEKAPKRRANGRPVILPKLKWQAKQAQPTSKASKPRKSQGNGVSEPSGGQVK